MRKRAVAIIGGTGSNPEFDDKVSLFERRISQSCLPYWLVTTVGVLRTLWVACSVLSIFFSASTCQNVVISTGADRTAHFLRHEIGVLAHHNRNPPDSRHLQVTAKIEQFGTIVAVNNQL